MDYFEDQEDDEVAHYRTAMVCENGHTVTDDVEGSPERTAAFCPECGARTLTACPNCGQGVRGYYKVPSITDLTGRVAPVPAFCHACGQPYPWTRAKLDSLRELVEETAGLTDEEKAKLSRGLDDIIADTPRTEVAAMRVKRWLANAGREIGAAGFLDGGGGLACPGGDLTV